MTEDQLHQVGLEATFAVSRMLMSSHLDITDPVKIGEAIRVAYEAAVKDGSKVV